MATYRYQRAFTPVPDQAVLPFLHRRIDDFLCILNNHLDDQVVTRTRHSTRRNFRPSASSLITIVCSVAALQN
jgi:hypothetical protein